MVLQCKKGKYFATGEVFPLDIGLLMGAIIRGHARRDFYFNIDLVVQIFRPSKLG